MAEKKAAGRGRRAAALKRALLEAVTPEDMAEIARAIVRMAKQGDRRAAQLLLDRILGKPAQNRAAAEPLELGYITIDDDEPEGDGADGISIDMEAFNAQLKARQGQ